MKKSNQWNKKARNYNRYNTKSDSFEAKILQMVDDIGIKFENKTFIDIGAGTGVYTIRVAKLASEVEALDFSDEMLEVLKEDASKENIKNISTCTTSWQEYKSEKIYDIALCTMSPALDKDEDFEKFDKIAKTKIYLGWAGKRDSNILNALFEAHDKTYTPPNGSAKLKKWLEKNDIPFTCKEVEELKISTCKDIDASSKYKWHLEIRDVKPDEKILNQVLKEFSKDGIVTEKTKNKMNLIVW